MSGLESLVLTYVLNSLWQVPLIAAAAWVAARVVRPAGPAMEHRVWVGALVGEAALPGISMLPWERLEVAWPWGMRAADAPGGSVVVQMGAGVGTGGMHFPAVVAGVLSAVFAVAMLYFAARFAWRWWRLAELCGAAETVELSGRAALMWESQRAQFGAEGTELVWSREIFAPLTMGIVKKRVVLPAEMIANLAEPELETVMGHELAHVQRKDFVKNLLYEFVTLPVSYHPGVWFTRQRMTESREMVCDEMAAGIAGRREYAQSLLRLAGLLLQGRQVRVPYAIGV